MRVIGFPSGSPSPEQDAWSAELDAALRGESIGPAARSWRELSEDVRSLAPPMSPAFQARMRTELERAGALEGRPAAAEVPGMRGEATRPGAFGRLRRLPAKLAAHRGPALAGAALTAVAVAAAVIAAQPGGSAVELQSSPQRVPALTSPASPGPEKAQAAPSTATGEAPSASAQSGPAGAGAPGRVQQVGASLTLGSTPAGVQPLSDEVGQMTIRDGGYVQSSNVQVQQDGASEATLALRLPSARLGAELAALARLAPVREETQSQQDITGSYNAARRALSDAEAERRALLRALAAATTEGQIASLRERLVVARAAIVRAQGAFNAISTRASTAEVEVSIVGDEKAGAEGLTLRRGLRDAGRVLLVTVSAILVAAAVLVPIALIAALVLGTRRAWIRRRREGALDTR